MLMPLAGRIDTAWLTRNTSLPSHWIRFPVAFPISAAVNPLDCSPRNQNPVPAPCEVALCDAHHACRAAQGPDHELGGEIYALPSLFRTLAIGTGHLELQIAGLVTSNIIRPPPAGPNITEPSTGPVPGAHAGRIQHLHAVGGVDLQPGGASSDRQTPRQRYWCRCRRRRSDCRSPTALATPPHPGRSEHCQRSSARTSCPAPARAARRDRYTRRRRRSACRYRRSHRRHTTDLFATLPDPRHPAPRCRDNPPGRWHSGSSCQAPSALRACRRTARPASSRTPRRRPGAARRCA